MGAKFCCLIINNDNKELLSWQHPEVKWLWFPLTAVALWALWVWLVLMQPHCWSAGVLRTCSWAVYTSNTVTSEFALGSSVTRCTSWCRCDVRASFSVAAAASQRVVLSAVTGPSGRHSSVPTSVCQTESICSVCQQSPPTPLFLCSLHYCFGSSIGLSLFHSSCSPIFYWVAGNPLPPSGVRIPFKLAGPVLGSVELKRPSAFTPPRALRQNDGNNLLTSVNLSIHVELQWQQSSKLSTLPLVLHAKSV